MAMQMSFEESMQVDKPEFASFQTKSLSLAGILLRSGQLRLQSDSYQVSEWERNAVHVISCSVTLGLACATPSALKRFQ